MRGKIIKSRASNAKLRIRGALHSYYYNITQLASVIIFYHIIIVPYNIAYTILFINCTLCHGYNCCPLDISFFKNAENKRAGLYFRRRSRHFRLFFNNNIASSVKYHPRVLNVLIILLIKYDNPVIEKFFFRKG